MGQLLAMSMATKHAYLFILLAPASFTSFSVVMVLRETDNGGMEIHFQATSHSSKINNNSVNMRMNCNTMVISTDSYSMNKVAMSRI